MKVLFADYNEDQMTTFSADEDLVFVYGKLSDSVDRPIEVFENRNAMDEYVREFGHMARHGVATHQELTREEMQEMIDDFIEYYM